MSKTLLSESQVQQIKEAKATGKSNQAIADMLGVKFSTIRYYLAKHNVQGPTKEQLVAILTDYTSEQVKQVLELKAQLITNKEIVKITGLSIGQVKRIIKNNNAFLTPEQRQKNAIQGKTIKNPNWLADMQASAHTQQANQKRSETMKDKFIADPMNKERMGQYSKEFWESMTEEQRQEYLSKRQQATIESDKYQKYISKLRTKTGKENYKSVKILQQNGVQNFEQLMQQYADQHSGKYISGYKTSDEKCEWQCTKNHSFKMRPNNVQQGQWCPYCAHTGPSIGQTEMYEYIKQILPYEEILLGDRTVLDGKELDIYIPSKKIGIEYDGLIFHSNYYNNQNGRHYKKYQTCRKNDIRLLAFYEDEWKNKKEIVKSIIANKLGVFNGIKIRASKCELVKLENQKDFSVFFEQNHLDGNSSTAFVAYGLKYNKELIMCLSLRKHFRNQEIEIARMATRIGYQVQGGASRLFKAIPKPVVTFSNNRFSIGEVYRRNGFTLVSENPSNYFYTDCKKRISRFKHRKIDSESDFYQLFPEAIGMTEQEQNENGYTGIFLYGTKISFYRIEDYGHIKWSML